jgi:hypothetical protein
MAWNPSTKRKRHLLVDCKEFSKTAAAKDVKVVVERDEVLRKEASDKKVSMSLSRWAMHALN